MRKIISAFVAALLLTLASPVVGQAPPAVPVLPDTARVTSYSLTASTCACSVGFALYGDSTDVDQWLEVWVGGTKYLSTDPSHGWAITSATGSLATIPRPVTNGILTFTSPQTATVKIVGARRPRRTSQFAENRGVAARDLNQVITDLTAQNRENWDKVNRAIVGQPGEVFSALPLAATRASSILGFDGLGNVTLYPPTAGVVSAATVTYVPGSTGAVARTVQDRLRDAVSLKDFGAVGDGTTNDTAAVALANAVTGPVFTPAGTYLTSANFFSLLGARFYGDGQLIMGGYKQARDRSFLTTDPGDPSTDRTQMFDGMSNKAHSLGYSFVGANVGAATPSGYRTLTGAGQSLRIYDFAGGNNGNNGDNVNRTGAAQDFLRIYHGGQGDVSGTLFYGQVYVNRPSATHFLAEPAIIHTGGTLEAAGTATGAYLQGSEFHYNDGGLAVAAIDRVRNYNRTNAGVTLGQVWIHDRPQSVGSQPVDAAYSVAGAFNRGLDFTPTTFDVNKSAINLKSGDRIYFNSSSAADSSGAKWFATTLGSQYMSYDGTNVVITGAGIATAGAVVSSAATGVGYVTGAGGTVTQSSNKSTTVVLNKASGAITMNNAALAAATIVSFTFTNSSIAATDVLVLNHISGGTVGSYSLNAQAGAGSATINVRNNTGGSLSEAIVIQFALIKGANS